MTDLEISKALALAIGWKASDLLVLNSSDLLVWVDDGWGTTYWREFDYRDWNVIGPIAKRYKCFPEPDLVDNWTSDGWLTEADTPQKAIALAVIGAKK